MGRDEALARWLMDSMLARWLMDSIKRLGDVSDDEEALRKHIFSTYKWLRWGMLVIAFLFPWWLVLGGLYYSMEWQDSMSAYYWAVPEKGGDAPMRVWFVGLLFALGTCLFLYKGYTGLEDWLLNVAGVFAICVAIFPMCWGLACPSWGLHYWGLHYWGLHYIFAFGFFIFVALVAILHGLYAWGSLRSRPHQGSEDRPPKKYAKWYMGLALVMGIAPYVTYKFVNPFWAEAVGIGAFCGFWVVQIVQIYYSNFDEDLAKSRTPDQGTESLT